MDRLTDSTYLQRRWHETFREGKQAIPAEAGIRFGEAGMAPVKISGVESTETTHFSVIDKEGNAVAVTTTVNGYFGSAFVPPGTGVVMNNEMDDFSIQPGVANMFGLVGAEANAVTARKRPLSSMSPTIVRDAQGNNRVILGAAGGPTITTSVFQSIVNRFRFGMALPDAVAAARFHQQWKPPTLKIERNAFSAEVVAKLESYGWKVEETRALGRIHALERFPDGRVWGVPDRRAEGAAVAE
jgi:gamma-glutamyltranspeptidase/glutathione hydrolase